MFFFYFLPPIVLLLSQGKLNQKLKICFSLFPQSLHSRRGERTLVLQLPSSFAHFTGHCGYRLALLLLHGLPSCSVHFCPVVLLCALLPSARPSCSVPFCQVPGLPALWRLHPAPGISILPWVTLSCIVRMCQVLCVFTLSEAPRTSPVPFPANCHTSIPTLKSCPQHPLLVPHSSSDALPPLPAASFPISAMEPASLPMLFSFKHFQTVIESVLK